MFGLKSMPVAMVTASLALLLASSTPCVAQGRRSNRVEQGQAPKQPRPQGQPQGHHAGQWLRRYKDLPSEQQKKALENDPQFRNLPPERQQKLRERLQHFNGLLPEQQQRILNRMETWEHLTPQQKQQARQLYAQLKDLPPERRRMLQTAIGGLRAMPPEQRQQVIESDRFKSMFSPQERSLLTGISQLPLAPADGGQNEQGPEE